MEFTEVVSPSVAVPVLCVLVCAFLVFAFGFKSPAQPPSFDVFDDDGKKKRSKKSKVSRYCFACCIARNALTHWT